MPATAGPGRLVTLRKRSEFLSVRGGAKWATSAFLLEAKARPATDSADVRPRFGLTVTKRLGTAVVRNRIRRRLKEALRTVAMADAQAGHDYVIVARAGALRCSFERLVADFRQAFSKVHRNAHPAG
ncbi:MAG: ribonuclease P protein component [Hyphomicrobiaceae bacterium]